MAYTSIVSVVDFLTTLGITIVAADIPAELIDAADDILNYMSKKPSGWGVSSDDILLDGNGEKWIIIPRKIGSISAVKIRNINQDDEFIVDSDNYTVDTNNSIITLDQSVSGVGTTYTTFKEGSQNVTISGVFGEIAPNLIATLATYIVIDNMMQFKKGPKGWNIDVISEKISKYSYRLADGASGSTIGDRIQTLIVMLPKNDQTFLEEG